MQRVLARRDVARVPTNDPTISALTQSLQSRAGDELVWSTKIEDARARLESSDDVVTYVVDDPAWWVEAIARSTDPHPPVLRGNQVDRNLGELTRRTSKPANWGRLLFRIVRNLQPSACLELGTSVGMSGSYLAAGLTANGAGRLITIEGQAESAAVARRVFEEVGVSGAAEVRVGQFNDLLPVAIESLGQLDLAFVDGHHLYEPTKEYFEAVVSRARPGSLLVFDDVVYWHPGMADAWREIQEDSRVSGTVTIGAVGFAVVGGSPTGHWRVRHLELGEL